jgi:hypothetical protein
MLLIVFEVGCLAILSGRMRPHFTMALGTSLDPVFVETKRIFQCDAGPNPTNLDFASRYVAVHFSPLRKLFA